MFANCCLAGRCLLIFTGSMASSDFPPVVENMLTFLLCKHVCAMYMYAKISFRVGMCAIFLMVSLYNLSAGGGTCLNSSQLVRLVPTFLWFHM